MGNKYVISHSCQAVQLIQPKGEGWICPSSLGNTVYSGLFLYCAIIFVFFVWELCKKKMRDFDTCYMQVDFSL